MPRQVTKATGNRYCQARMRAAKYNEKLLTRSGAAAKSVKMRPLMARIKALLKRILPENDVLEVGEISIDLNARTVSVEGRIVELTPKEFELLLYLAQYQNVAKSRQQILHSVWNTDYYGDARTVDTHVKNLRMKLGEAGNRIRTVRGMGYLLGTRE